MWGLIVADGEQTLSREISCIPVTDLHVLVSVVLACTPSMSTEWSVVNNVVQG